MIWDHLSFDAMERGHRAYLSALEGAIFRAQMRLPMGAGTLDAANGLIETARFVHTGPICFEGSARALDAYALGNEHGGAAIEREGVPDVYLLLENLLQRDALQAASVIRRMVLRYASLRHHTGHLQALAEVTGEVAGNNPFKQIDRASRSLDSTSFVINQARHLAAQAYLDGFLDAAMTQPAVDLVELVHPEGGVRQLWLSRTTRAELGELFHPNTRFTLRLAEAA